MTIMIYLNAIPSNANSICAASDGFVFFLFRRRSQNIRIMQEGECKPIQPVATTGVPSQ